MRCLVHFVLSNPELFTQFPEAPYFVTNTPALSGTNNVVTNAASGRENYYRLRAP